MAVFISSIQHAFPGWCDCERPGWLPSSLLTALPSLVSLVLVVVAASWCYFAVIALVGQAESHGTQAGLELAR